MKIIITAISFSFLIAACGNEAETKKENEEINKTEEPKEETKEVVVADFPSFWKDFRKAIMDGDSTFIMENTTFPLETRGPMDEDPINKYSKTHFNRILFIYLNQFSGLLDEGSELDYIKTIETPAADDFNEEWARIGGMQFKIVNNKWSLYFLYLEPASIEEIYNHGWE